MLTLWPWNIRPNMHSIASVYDWLILYFSGPEPKPEFKADERTFRLWLDTNQYQQDMAETVHGSEVFTKNLR